MLLFYRDCIQSSNEFLISRVLCLLVDGLKAVQSVSCLPDDDVGGLYQHILYTDEFFLSGISKVIPIPQCSKSIVFDHLYSLTKSVDESCPSKQQLTPLCRGLLLISTETVNALCVGRIQRYWLFKQGVHAVTRLPWWVNYRNIAVCRVCVRQTFMSPRAWHCRHVTPTRLWDNNTANSPNANPDSSSVPELLAQTLSGTWYLS
jgi:hypothetical protein